MTSQIASSSQTLRDASSSKEEDIPMIIQEYGNSYLHQDENFKFNKHYMKDHLKTFIYTACKYNDTVLVLDLLQNIFNTDQERVDFITKKMKNLLYIACKYNNEAIALKILNLGFTDNYVKCGSNYALTSLYYAITNNMNSVLLKMVETDNLLDFYDENNHDALRLSLETGVSTEVILKLIQSAKIKKRYNTINYVCSSLDKSDYEEIAISILDNTPTTKNLSRHTKCDTSQTPLLNACQHSCEPIIDKLLKFDNIGLLERTVRYGKHDKNASQREIWTNAPDRIKFDREYYKGYDVQSYVKSPNYIDVNEYKNNVYKLPGKTCFDICCEKSMYRFIEKFINHAEFKTLFNTERSYSHNYISTIAKANLIMKVICKYPNAAKYIPQMTSYKLFKDTKFVHNITYIMCDHILKHNNVRLLDHLIKQNIIDLKVPYADTTLLIQACKYKNIPLSFELLNRNINTTYKNTRNETALTFAKKNNLKEISTVLNILQSYRSEIKNEIIEEGYVKKQNKRQKQRQNEIKPPQFRSSSSYIQSLKEQIIANFK